MVIELGLSVGETQGSAEDCGKPETMCHIKKGQLLLSSSQFFRVAENPYFTVKFPYYYHFLS